MLEFLDEALTEAEEAGRWYGERSESAAAAFAEELQRAISAIETQPGTWPSFLFGTRRFLLKRFPYSIVYLVEAKTIFVIAVAHARRCPGYWRVRMNPARPL